MRSQKDRFGNAGSVKADLGAAAAKWCFVRIVAIGAGRIVCAFRPLSSNAFEKAVRIKHFKGTVEMPATRTFLSAIDNNNYLVVLGPKPNAPILSFRVPVLLGSRVPCDLQIWSGSSILNGYSPTDVLVGG